MRFGSLFTGIGGLDLGLERAGFEVAWQVEWDPFCTHILEGHWPHVRRYTDAAAVDWASVEPVDLLAGGFPCQPVSHAGSRRGADDARWLWPAFRDAIDAIRPEYVLIENVPGLVTLGLDAVLGDLDARGYNTERDIVSAADVGSVAPPREALHRGLPL